MWIAQFAPELGVAVKPLSLDSGASSTAGVRVGGAHLPLHRGITRASTSVPRTTPSAEHRPMADGVIRHPSSRSPLIFSCAVGVSWKSASIGSSFRGEAGLRIVAPDGMVASDAIGCATGDQQV